MDLVIDNNTLIKDIQKQFNSQYPCLKIEFFKRVSTEKRVNTKADKLSPDSNIWKLGKMSKSGNISIDGLRTVSDLTTDIRRITGLATQVYRKSGNLWIEATLTENWTLEKQNKEGESFNNPSRSWSSKLEDDRFDDE